METRQWIQYNEGRRGSCRTVRLGSGVRVDGGGRGLLGETLGPTPPQVGSLLSDIPHSGWVQGDVPGRSDRPLGASGRLHQRVRKSTLREGPRDRERTKGTTDYRWGKV